VNLREKILTMRSQRAQWIEVLETLNNERYLTANGKPWTMATLRYFLMRYTPELIRQSKRSFANKLALSGTQNLPLLSLSGGEIERIINVITSSQDLSAKEKKAAVLVINSFAVNSERNSTVSSEEE
jgi:hypothetical protein